MGFDERLPVNYKDLIQNEEEDIGCFPFQTYQENQSGGDVERGDNTEEVPEPQEVVRTGQEFYRNYRELGN